MVGELKRGMRLVIASHNEGKVRELAELFAMLGIETVPAAELGLVEPEETGETFADNAKIKAEAATATSGLPAIADDSGLEVPALGGAPGVNSARWAGPERDFGRAMARVSRELEAIGATDRRANFICALALARPKEKTMVFKGRVDGTLTWPPRGKRGFGYDPIFVPEGHTLTFGEMEPRRKNDLSHRMRAFELLMLATYGHD